MTQDYIAQQAPTLSLTICSKPVSPKSKASIFPLWRLLVWPVVSTAFGERHRYTVADVTQWSPDKHYDVWHDRAALLF